MPVMPVHEKLNIMDTATRFTDSRKKNLRKIIIFGIIFLLSLLVTGLIVYSLASCSEPQPIPACNENSFTVSSLHEIPTTPNNAYTAARTANLDDNIVFEDEKTTVTTTSTTPAPVTTETASMPEDLNLRLPRSIRPMAYAVKLIPYFEEKNFTFDGSCRIVIDVKENTKNITLHSIGLAINESDVAVYQITELVGVDGDALEGLDQVEVEIPINNITFVEKKQFLIFNFDEILVQNLSYVIYINYTGQLKDDLKGFYRSSYKNGNETRWLAATQFQPTDARRAFPCFDEPEMKAQFSISIARPKHMVSLSNMPRILNEDVDGVPNYKWDIYQESVPMSTYLVAFVVCDFVSQTSGNFAVWARADAIKSAKYALEVGPKLLKFMEQYFGIDFPLPKIDMIALPDFSAGAMENWGLITYRETAMLYNEGVSTHFNKQQIGSVVSHELGHQWFGNLVTPSWWSDLWLNEGFASYMEYVGVNAVEPNWKLTDQFVVAELQSVFSLDALSSSHQISVHVQNPDEINEIFDRISYAKGASIIRMMDHFLTTEVFKTGLRQYLNDKKYVSAEQDDLWNSLTEAARDAHIFDENTSVKVIMDTWTLQTGFPVVHVTRDYDKSAIYFRQERFFLVEDAKTKNASDDPVWWIPLTYTTRREMDFESTKPLNWMRGQKETGSHNVDVDVNDWIIANIQETGYYRVNYDLRNWNAITTHLRDPMKYHEIGTTNRAQLIDDALNLARAGYLNYSVALNVTRYLAHETDYVPWAAAIQGLNFIDSMLIKRGDYYLFKAYFQSLLEKVYQVVGFEDFTKNNDILTIFKRVDVLTAACHLGMKDCIHQSVRKFHSWMNEPDPDRNNPISTNLKEVVYCMAIKYGGEYEWDFAWERYHKTTISSEKEIILSALGCSREIWILTRYLERALKMEHGIRKQDVFKVFNSVSNNIHGQPVAFNYIRSNYKEIKTYLGASPYLNTMLEFSTRRMNSRFEVDELKRFAASDLKDGGRTIQQVIERSEANISWMDKNYQSIIDWLSLISSPVSSSR